MGNARINMLNVRNFSCAPVNPRTSLICDGNQWKPFSTVRWRLAWETSSDGVQLFRIFITSGEHRPTRESRGRRRPVGIWPTLAANKNPAVTPWDCTQLPNYFIGQRFLQLYWVRPQRGIPECGIFARFWRTFIRRPTRSNHREILLR